ncbi:acid-sensing ion channel 3-like [Acropora muricata]|uniref:acid-sensing ion channel 3-like n=1 Tax=Acropora muricata TaxID=159855 RepID=UPI0034E3F22B
MQSTNKTNGSSGKSQLWKLVEEKILECFGYTTAHGYGRVADAPAGSWPRRCFWLLACAAAFAIFVYQLHVLTQQYLSKPLKTRTRIIHEQNIQFPQVTVCNLNKVRRSKMPDDILRTYPQILGPITNTTDELSKLQGHNLKRRIHEILAEYPDDVLRDAGHQLEDLILECKYHKKECLHGMRDYWTWFWHPKYGNCFTFNRGSDAQNKPITVLTSSLPGHAAGLKLELNIEQYEYPSEKLTDEAGVRVFIGHQDLMPFPYELGISAPPGDSTEIMLRKIVLGRLDPFGNKSCEEKSTVDNDSIFSRYNASYSEMVCEISCLSNRMHEKCGCVDYKIKYDKTQRVCNTSHHHVVKCIDEVLDDYATAVCTRNCRQKCREDTFKMTVSAARWPSEHYKDILRRNLQNRGLGNHSNDLHINFLKLKVYYGELNYEAIDEELAYPFSHFFSDIGGIMGMWIGISALTCVEILELLAFLCCAVWRNREGKQSVNEVRRGDSPV